MFTVCVVLGMIGGIGVIGYICIMYLIATAIELKRWSETGIFDKEGDLFTLLSAQSISYGLTLGFFISEYIWGGFLDGMSGGIQLLYILIFILTGFLVTVCLSKMILKLLRPGTKFLCWASIKPEVVGESRCPKLEEFFF